MTSVELRPAQERPRVPLHSDPAQERVLAHRDGPLLVLAGPGTGKTATLVESVARRVEGGTPVDRVLVLTFSRRAAMELRERIGLRLGVTRATPAAWTFHAYCFALLRSQRDPTAVSGPLRLLTGPQQQAMVREMLTGDAFEHPQSWPPALRACLRTRGLAEEVRTLMSRARALGLDPAALAACGTAAGRADWQSAAAFIEQYLQVLDLQGLLDYGELVHRAADLAADPQLQTQLRGQLDAVLVDEYQDTDPAQERLLQALAGDGRDLVVVGDPDQAIYGFRGADVRGLLAFRSRFPTRDGGTAPVETLQTCRRSGPDLLHLTRGVAARLPAGGLPADSVRAHRALRAASGLPGGQAEVRLYATAAAEAAGVADVLRRAHLQDGVAWERMAVLVRSAARSLPLLRRVLTGAGVPVVTAGDELPLADEPAVAPLLLALRVVAEPSRLDAETVRLLLLSPLVGADPAQLRRLGRRLRVQRRDLAAQAGLPPAPLSAGELIAEAVRDTSLLTALPRGTGAPAARLAALLGAAGAELERAGGAEGALWTLWSGSSWPQRLEAAALAGGPGGRDADCDLDAVLALFDAARRHGELHPGSGVTSLLEELAAQEIPADTLSERGVASTGVRVLTAHRSKGLEWDLVVVCAVQEGHWPDLRRRGSLLEPDRLGPDGLVAAPEPSQQLAEERRLFYVALTRARERLVVTAVSGSAEDGQRPSRFVAELGLPLLEVAQLAPDPLTLSGLVARLRHAAVDETASPALRSAAAARLGALAGADDGSGQVLVPAAHPDRWWGLAPLTEAPDSPYPPELPVELSGTSLEALQRCPLQWLLQHEIGAVEASGPAIGIGRLLHALAEDVAAGRRPPDPVVLQETVDEVWPDIRFEARWLAVRQRESVAAGLGRLLDWLARGDARAGVAAEAPFDVTLDLPAGPVRLRGRADRIELDTDGLVWVVDLKTGTSSPSAKSAPENPQLGVYQLAVLRGAFGALLPEQARPGGAELLQLRAGEGSSALVQAQPALRAGDDGLTWVEWLLSATVARLQAEDFPARPGDHCMHCRLRTTCPAQPEGRPVVA